MVDSHRRKTLAFHLRQLATGVISNDDFEGAVAEEISYGWLPDQYYRSREAKEDDGAILPILELCWTLYTDIREQYLRGSERVSGETQTMLARMILFLQTDQEYEWPYFDIKVSLLDMLFSLLTLGIWYRIGRKRKEAAFGEYKKTGDYAVWPFRDRVHYESALAKPPFLSRSA